jgi:hypothetical protein
MHRGVHRWMGYGWMGYGWMGYGWMGYGWMGYGGVHGWSSAFSSDSLAAASMAPSR